MEIQKSTAVSGISSYSNNPPKEFPKLQAGASLDAVVIEKSEDNNYTLKLTDGRLLHAQSQTELQPGQTLKLEVVKSGTVPELKIVWPDQPGTKTELILQNALKQLLPKQVNLTELASLLRQNATAPTEKANAAIGAVLDSLVPKNQLMTAEGLKEAVTNSGVFLEAKLAQQLNPQGDLKGQLLLLANALQKAVSEQAVANTARTLPDQLPSLLDASHTLLAKTEGAVARIMLDQLAALPQDNQTQTTWQIGIPFTDGAHTDTLNLKIQREDAANSAQLQPNWSVILELNPPGMGMLHCKISLFDGKLDTYFWGDLPDSMNQIQENLDMLAARYTEAGLAVGNLDVVDGAKISTEPSQKERMPPLLDEFA
jgi:Flagellar hook-length control protein FliK